MKTIFVHIVKIFIFCFFSSLLLIKDLIPAKMIAHIGTPTIIPKTPHSPPKNVIAKITQNPAKPVEFPKILGPKILPSNCCNISMKRTK